MNEDEWGDLECLYKSCQTAITIRGLFTDTGIVEWGDDEWQGWRWQWDEKREPVSQKMMNDKGEDDNEMRNVSQLVKRSENFQK